MCCVQSSYRYRVGLILFAASRLAVLYTCAHAPLPQCKSSAKTELNTYMIHPLRRAVNDEIHSFRLGEQVSILLPHKSSDFSSLWLEMQEKDRGFPVEQSPMKSNAKLLSYGAPNSPNSNVTGKLFHFAPKPR